MKTFFLGSMAALLLVSCGERSGAPHEAARGSESTSSGVGPTESGSSSTKPTSDPLQTSLGRIAAKLVEALRNGDREMFLSLCSRKGVDIGADGWTPFEEFRREVRHRGYSYCHYFDTACLQKLLRDIHHSPGEDIEGRLPLPVSYREALNSVRGIEIRERVRTTESGESVGSVTVKWNSPRPRDLGLTGYLHFSFVQEEGEWRLCADSFP